MDPSQEDVLQKPEIKLRRRTARGLPRLPPLDTLKNHTAAPGPGTSSGRRTGKPPLPPGRRREFMSVRVLPSTKEAIKEYGMTTHGKPDYGRSLDDIVAMALERGILKADHSGFAPARRPEDRTPIVTV